MFRGLLIVFFLLVLGSGRHYRDDEGDYGYESSASGWDPSTLVVFRVLSPPGFMYLCNDDVYHVFVCVLAIFAGVSARRGGGTRGVLYFWTYGVCYACTSTLDLLTDSSLLLTTIFL